jgi:hypothetical protein
MSFNSRIKGKITQSLVATLLEDAGYHIATLGIEEIVREVKNLSTEQYVALNLPKALRNLPDFFISCPDFKDSWLVEVKFRKRWNEETKKYLLDNIESQVKIWQPLLLVVFLGERARETETPASYLGALRLIERDNEIGAQYFVEVDGMTEEHFVPWDEITWSTFFRLQDVFTHVGKSWEQATLVKALAVLKQLSNAEVFG